MDQQQHPTEEIVTGTLDSVRPLQEWDELYLVALKDDNSVELGEATDAYNEAMFTKASPPSWQP